MSVLVKEVIDKLRLDIVYGEPELLEKEINTGDICRPGLEMTGYFDYYTPERIQLLGMKEWSYLISMSSHNRYQVLKKLFQPETPAVIVARGLVVPEEMLKAARECKIAILTSRTATSRLSGELSSYLDSRLAERASVHGVLMDIYGMGVLIQGDSGIGKSETGLELVKRGVERKEADEKLFNIPQLKKDLQRDKEICKFLTTVLTRLSKKDHDRKLNAFADKIVERLEENKYGKKLLVFSFFSDTIDYLKERLPQILENRIPDFSKRAEFISGNSGSVEEITKRFSPISKKAKIKKQSELDFLFATDVLSEGQNLQDAGFLVNYDLHWNPVRMIQRNGRINRLGSTYENILIANMKPHEDLEFYLKLIRRLEHKIATINFTVGNDQSILGESENPIEFHEILESDNIFDDDTDKASKAMEQFENTEDILDWVDNYSTELRKFIDAHKEDGEIKRIQSIPEGKWNYLPKSTENFENPDYVIGLYRAKGKISATGALIKDIGFVSIEKSSEKRGPFSSLQAKYIQEKDALKQIQTTPQDNKRMIDKIPVDRSEYIKKGSTEISVQFESANPVYSIKQQGMQALEILKTYFDSSYNLVGIIEKGIRYSNDKRTFEQIVREVNKQNKENGKLTPRVIKNFENLLTKLLQAESDEKRIEKVEGVLFYAKP